MKEIVKVTRIENEFVVVVNNVGKESKRKYFELNNRIQKIVETKMAFNYKGYVYPIDLKVEESVSGEEIKNRYTWDELSGRRTKATVETPKAVVKTKEVKHDKFNQIKTCIELNIPVYLAGPAGSGKNHTLEQIAKEMGLDFYFTNSVQQEYKLTGFIDAGGIYHETEFYKAFKNGGLFFLDEMDASIPEVLVLLNAAIANGYFEFPNGRINAHEDFRVVAAGNTVGQGADEDYTGRMVLDQATLDRFAIIEFDYSRKIEMLLSNGNKELVDFIRDLRKQSKQNGVRATYSYRCIAMVTKLESAGMNLKDILSITVFKGLDKDTIRTYEVKENNKYFDCLSEMKK